MTTRHDHGVQTESRGATTPGHKRVGSEKLQDQAATAALYVTKHDKASKQGPNYALDDNNKLSAAGAATSLKHANPRDLPSFPTVGLAEGDSAGTAATLANRNKKTFEHWKPDPSASASAAAMLAKDYEAPEPWHPEMSAAGSKAALLAANKGGNVEIWQPKRTEWGISAAHQAAWKSGTLAPNAYDGLDADGHRKSLIAATGAVTNSRRRADSTPQAANNYPDAANSAANALKGAIRAAKPHGSSRSALDSTELSPSMEAARIQHAHTSRQMYTSTPPVAIQLEEQRRKDTLHASAVAMARQMYAAQGQSGTQARSARASDSYVAAKASHSRQAIDASEADMAGPMRFNSLEEAAKKLAAERLARLHDEHAEYRQYYGTSPTPVTHRMSLRGKPRRARASSTGTVDDAEQSARIRSEMSIFNQKLSEVDTKKRQIDRDALMKAAQRNVRASMHNMDEKVYASTGKVTPSMREEWEVKARAKADADSKARMTNYGKVDIGGGVFIDQADVDAVALRNVQPVLDEINDNAERRRQKEAEIQMQQENAQRVMAEEKARDRERKTESKRIKALEKDEAHKRKEEEKARHGREKEEERLRKMSDKVMRDEERRRQKEEWQQANQHAKEQSTPTVATLRKKPDHETDHPSTSSAVTKPVTTEQGSEQATRALTATTVVSDPSDASPSMVTSHHVSSETQAESTPKSKTTATPIDTIRANQTDNAPAATSGKKSPTSPSSPSKSGVKSWIKGKFSHRASKSRDNSDTQGSIPSATNSKEKNVASSAFVGGVALTGPPNSATQAHNSSMRDVAMAGRVPAEKPRSKHSSQGSISPTPEDDFVSPLEERSTLSLRSISTDADVSLDPVGGKHIHAHPGQTTENTVASKRNSHPTQGDVTILKKETTGDEKSIEVFEEANDNFESEILVPPPAISGGTRIRNSESPARDSKFREEL